jgi:hypothetical protein
MQPVAEIIRAAQSESIMEDEFKMARKSDSSPSSLLLTTIFVMTVIALSQPLWALPLFPEDEADGIEVQVGKTVEITSSYRYCWYPTVHRFTSAEIMVTMRMSPDEVNPEGDFSAYCISKDKGLTWSPRYTMGAGANVDGAYTESPRPDGTIWQLYGWVESYLPEPAEHLTLTKFSRGGMEFQQWRDVPLQMSQPVHLARTELFDRRVQDGSLAKQPSVVPWGPIFEALDGDLLAPVYYTAERDQRYYRLALIRSSDGGKSWSEYSTVAAVELGEKPWPGIGDEGPCEAGVVRLADKRLYAIYRTGGDGFIGQAWSSDDGKTWTKPTSTPYKGVALRVRRLSNGALACTTGRPGPVVVMFSVDGSAANWSHITPIFNGKSTHYTDFIEVEPGKLLVVYDSVPYGWHEIPYSDRESKNVIYGTFIEVRKNRH